MMFMDLIYLNYNCFQRGFDDRRQIKIQLEASACEEIFARTERRDIRLIWSFMHEDENILCPFIERRLEVFRLSTLCSVRIGPDIEIYRKAKVFQRKGGVSPKDAIHLACADLAQSDFFLTCDDDLIKHARRLTLDIRIMNPVEYIREVDVI